MAKELDIDNMRVEEFLLPVLLPMYYSSRHRDRVNTVKNRKKLKRLTTSLRPRYTTSSTTTGASRGTMPNTSPRNPPQIWKLFEPPLPYSIDFLVLPLPLEVLQAGTLS